MSAPSALQFARDNRDRFLDELTQLLRIPSVSTLPDHRQDMLEAANWLASRLTTIGFQAETIPGDGPPLVYGEWLGAGNAPTVLVYGHYDVQPVDPLELWTTPPFEPTVRGNNIYARGAADDKGQTMTFLNAAESLLRTEGALPINLKILIEGEEECGGAVIKAYVAEHGARLRADFVQVADSGMFAPGVPMLESRLRGIVYTEVFAQGAAHDLHSGLYGGVAPNPLNALGQVIAGLKDLKGRITIPGFYDDVRMPDQHVLESWRQLPYSDEALMGEMGTHEIVGEAGYTPLERAWARPTLDVHGIPGGFVGEGAKTVIPARASAKISMRLVPDQRADRIFDLFSTRVSELGSPGIELDPKLIHGDDPVVVPSNSHAIALAREALAETFGRPAVLGGSGGSIPIVGIFKERLRLDSLLMGWGLPDDNLHAPNEKFSLDNFFLGTEATIRFWQLLGDNPAR